MNVSVGERMESKASLKRIRSQSVWPPWADGLKKLAACVRYRWWATATDDHCGVGCLAVAYTQTDFNKNKAAAVYYHDKGATSIIEGPIPLVMLSSSLRHGMHAGTIPKGGVPDVAALLSALALLQPALPRQRLSPYWALESRT